MWLRISFTCQPLAVHWCVFLTKFLLKSQFHMISKHKSTYKSFRNSAVHQKHCLKVVYAFIKMKYINLYFP